jgi:arylformamidase
VHVGAHTDAPNHFVAGAAGIGEVDVGKYVGSCQVIQVSVERGGVILPSHLKGTEVVASRVIFKTGSFPDPRHFNSDFVGLSAELVRFLDAQGVVLVGIDTASIDVSDSKTLDAHHATASAGMAILEGVVLDGVAPGIYELVAVPLKIQGGDASPVRALLRKTCSTQ